MGESVQVLSCNLKILPHIRAWTQAPPQVNRPIARLLCHFVNKCHACNPGVTRRQYNDAPATRLVVILRTAFMNTLKMMLVDAVHACAGAYITLEALAVDNGGTALVILLL